MVKSSSDLTAANDKAEMSPECLVSIVYIVLAN